jgi:hypothetical protein
MRNNIMLSYLAQQVDEGELHWIEQEEQSDKWSKKLDTWVHVVIMISAQLAKAESLSDVTQLAGEIEEVVNKSSLSRVNTRTDRATIFEMLFRKLVTKAKRKNVPKGILETIEIIDTSYMLVPKVQFNDWRYDSTRGAVKIGLMFDLNRYIPSQLIITDGKVGDTTYLPKFRLKKKVLYMIDGGFRWYKQYDKMIEDEIDFIGRIQVNSHTTIIEEKPLPPINNGIYADQIVRLGKDKQDRMKSTVRVIRFIGKEGQDIWLATTRRDLTARQVVNLYKHRWEIEVFFKLIKQNLKIKKFFGTSEQAVKIQLYAALIAYLIVWLLKKTNASMLEAFRFVKYTLFQRLADVELQLKLANNSPPIILCNG